MIFVFSPTTLIPDYGRAFPINNAGAGYGNEISSTSLSSAQSRGLPVLQTITASGITSSSVQSGGEIALDGGSPITNRGGCWRTNLNLAMADNKTTDGTGIGRFASVINGLLENTLYTIRADATNGNGTGYGSPYTIYPSSTNHQWAYLGQTPPGRELLPFAKNIIGTWRHGEVTVSPDGQEIYWPTMRSILYTKIENGRWTTPATVSFSGGGSPRGDVPYDDNPVVSPDNKKIFFTSLRPTGYSSPSQENIWYAERTSTGWGEPKPLPRNVNSLPYLHWQISITNDGAVYFGANYKIYVTRFVNGAYSDPEEVPVANRFGDVMLPFIAPDESYLIFTKVTDGRPSGYISFKDNKEQWLLPKPMPLVSFKDNKGQSRPSFPLGGTLFITRDGKYIFSYFHWISAEILEDLRPKK